MGVTVDKMYEITTLDSKLKERRFKGKIIGFRQNNTLREYIIISAYNTDILTSISMKCIISIKEIEISTLEKNNTECTYITDVDISEIEKLIPKEFYDLVPGNRIMIDDFTRPFTIKDKDFLFSNNNTCTYNITTCDSYEFTLSIPLDISKSKIKIKKIGG